MTDDIDNGWLTYRLDELIEFNPKERLPKGTDAPYVEMAALPQNGRWHDKPVLCAVNSGSRFRDSDTLLARITPCLENGKTAQVRGLGVGVIGWGSTEFIVMRAKQGVADPSFVYLLARDPGFREYAIQQMTGTSGRQRVPTESIASFEVSLPPLDEQRRIAEVLGALDDRIDTAGRLIGLLSAAAQALSSTAPRTCAVSDLARTDRVHWYPGQHSGEAIDHYSLPAFDAGVGAERTEASEIASNKFQVRGPRVLFSRLNPDTSRTWLCIPSSDVSASVCSTEYAVLVAETTTVGQLWAVLSSGEVGDLLAAASTGTSASHQRVREDAILGATVADPRSLSMADQHAIDAYADSVVEKVRELKSLREARDFLLPRLVAGELRVAAAEEQVEAAT
jgi:type I restriction enzyme S subunit